VTELNTALSMPAKEVDTIQKELATIKTLQVVINIPTEAKTLTSKLTGKAFVVDTTKVSTVMAATGVDVVPTSLTTIRTIAMTIPIIGVVDTVVMDTTFIK